MTHLKVLDDIHYLVSLASASCPVQSILSQFSAWYL